VESRAYMTNRKSPADWSHPPLAKFNEFECENIRPQS
jgi:hypothetical protein